MEGELLMKPIRQILAIARAEFRFGFRRSAPVAATTVIGLIVSAGILIEPLANLSAGVINSKWTPEQAQAWTSYGYTLEQRAPFLRGMYADMFVFSTMMAWLLIFLALLLLPMATSASIPADRKFGLSDLLSSTPITGTVYLAGKVLGMLATVLLIGGIMLALFFAVTEIILFSRVHYGLSSGVIWFFIKLALLDGLPMLVFGTTVGVLIGILFRTRRAAIFPGFLAGVASLVCWAIAFRAPAQGYLGMTDLAYYYLVQNYHSPAIAVMTRMFGEDPNLFNIAGAPRVGIGQLALMYLAIIASLTLLAGLARLWLYKKENF
jgi:ABC-type transport system involved in multi-copper enzyme maturation permease subunit